MPCTASKELFLTENFDDLPKLWQIVIADQGGLPCDGGGHPGSWCWARIQECWWWQFPVAPCARYGDDDDFLV